MRKVLIPEGVRPPDDWLQRAEELTEQLRVAGTKEARTAIIEANERFWRDDRVRNWLLNLFNRKCWYTEAQESVSPYHVDHFRPKGRSVNGADVREEGYWWLAFDWSNYRICGNLINVKKKDQFPLAEPFVVDANHPEQIHFEAPLLIDPTTDDARLVSYEMDEDACIATAVPGADEVEKKRVEVTIDVIGLNRLPRLNLNRADTWRDSHDIILEYQSAATLPHCLKVLRQAMAVSKLKKSIEYERVFSSVADACIRKMAPESLKAKVYS